MPVSTSPARAGWGRRNRPAAGQAGKRGGKDGVIARVDGRVEQVSDADPGPSAEGGGLFQALSGNVGIGTKKPRVKLEVRGDVLITGELRVEGRNRNSRGRDCLRVAFDTAGAAVCGEGFSVAGIWKAGKAELETGGVVCCK